MNRLSNILPAVLIWLGYLIYFLVDSRSSEFVYAANSIFSIEEFDSLTHFSFEHFIAPWRYRIVPRVLQWWLFAALRPIVEVTYFQVALSLSSGFTATALASFYLLLRKLGSSVFLSMIGCVLAMGSFPLVFGYRLRNWMTFDDSLSYFLLIVGLLLVLFNTSKRGRIWFVVVSVLAALTRETTLQLLIVVLFDRRRTITERIAMAAPALVAFVVVRLLLFDTSEVTTTSGLPVPRLDLNLTEEGIVLTSAYAFAVFGVGWLLAAFGWVHFWRKRNELTDSIWLFWITTLMATVVLGGFNLLIGSIRENRTWHTLPARALARPTHN